jgi:hypothetical protein
VRKLAETVLVGDVEQTVRHGVRHTTSARHVSAQCELAAPPPNTC